MKQWDIFNEIMWLEISQGQRDFSKYSPKKEYFKISPIYDFEGDREECTKIHIPCRSYILYKPFIYKPDVYYDHHVESVQNNQFQIILRKWVKDSVFYINNLNVKVPTWLKIE